MNNIYTGQLPQHSSVHYPTQKTHHVNPSPLPQTQTMGFPQRVNHLPQSSSITSLDQIPKHILFELITNLNLEGDQLREKLTAAEGENRILKEKNDELSNEVKTMYQTCNHNINSIGQQKKNISGAQQASLQLIGIKLELERELKQKDQRINELTVSIKKFISKGLPQDYKETINKKMKNLQQQQQIEKENGLQEIKALHDENHKLKSLCNQQKMILQQLTENNKTNSQLEKRQHSTQAKRKRDPTDSSYGQPEKRANMQSTPVALPQSTPATAAIDLIEEDRAKHPTEECEKAPQDPFENPFPEENTFDDDDDDGFLNI